MFLQTDQSVKTKKRMMYSPGGPYIMVAPIVTSWAVAGQRMVFLHMYLQTRVMLKAFSVATPRGRSLKFPWRGTWLKKNFQHARIISTMEFSSVCFSTVFCYKENRSVIALAIYLFYIWLFILLIICIVNLVLWCSVYKDFSNVIKKKYCFKNLSFFSSHPPRKNRDTNRIVGLVYRYSPNI